MNKWMDLWLALGYPAKPPKIDKSKVSYKRSSETDWSTPVSVLEKRRVARDKLYDLWKET